MLERDYAVVAVNRSNKEAQASMEAGEGRAQTKENIVQSHKPPDTVPGNLTSLSLFRARLGRIWRHQLRKRGDQRKLDWKRFARICLRYLHPSRTLHPYPYQRFNVNHPRWEPYA